MLRVPAADITHMERIADSVEAIDTSVAQLVSRRQALRAAGADPALLERNRLEIARLQRLLSEALIKKYLPAAA
jgi:hypothetical protein